MLPKNTLWVVGAVVLAGVLGGIAWFKVAQIPAFPIQSQDTIASWNFTGSYAADETLVARATSEIARLEGMLGEGKYDDYDIYLGIGNDKSLLGDGGGAYESYNRAIAIHPQKGLAYVNLAHLMDILGAHETAKSAYAKAVLVEPAVLEYHLQRLNYLTRQFPKDSELLLAAFTDASNQFGDSAAILAIEAEWLSGQGRVADAIRAWETVRFLSPAPRQPSIDAEIARLKKKL